MGLGIEVTAIGKTAGFMSDVGWCILEVVWQQWKDRLGLGPSEN